MRLAIIGQQAFGKAVLDAFLERRDTVAGVSRRSRRARALAACLTQLRRHF